MFDCSANQERILKFYSYSGIDGIGSIERTLRSAVTAAYKHADFCQEPLTGDFFCMDKSSAGVCVCVCVGGGVFLTSARQNQSLSDQIRFLNVKTCLIFRRSDVL